MNKPVIAVTPTPDGGRLGVSETYITALERNGAIACMLGINPGADSFEEIAKYFDGFLFTGGDDIDPDLYGEPVHPGCGEITPARDNLEIGLYKEVAKQGKPVLAICRGIQVVNAAAGGTLYQDIPSEFERKEELPQLLHSQRSPAFVPTHFINISEGSKLQKIFGENRIRVNSHHHQSIKAVAPGFKVTSYADDGIIESIENDSMKFCVGVQWHPEKLAPTIEQQNRLFKAFVDACMR